MRASGWCWWEALHLGRQSLPSAAGNDSIVASALAKAALVKGCVAAPCCCAALLLACTHPCCSPSFRIEHPQELINQLQYGAADAAHVLRGKGPYPVAEYRLAAEISAAQAAQAAAATGGGEGSGWLADDWYQPLLASRTDGGAAQSGSEAGVAAEAPAARGVYSFCMCPGKAGLRCAVQLGRSVLAWAGARADCPSDLMRHVSFVRASAFCWLCAHTNRPHPLLAVVCAGGQIVPTSTNEEELCINGMSFSRYVMQAEQDWPRRLCMAACNVRSQWPVLLLLNMAAFAPRQT